MKNYVWMMLGVLIGAILWDQAPILMFSASERPPVNLLVFSDRLVSGGQPSAEQFPYIQNRDFDIVINLAPGDTTGSLHNEGYLVSTRQMKYINIPVSWDHPKLSDFTFFAAILNSNKDRKIFVHCQYNWRASVFIYLYRIIYEHKDPQAELEKVHQIWLPSQRWQQYIHRVLEMYNSQASSL